MFWKKQKTIISQANRIAELEEILCPCKQHDFVDVGYHFSGGSGMGDEAIVYHYICKRCKKEIQTIRRIR